MSAKGKYGGGSGTPEDPYQIRDDNHMQAIGTNTNDWNKYFKLMADIDLSGFTGSSFNIIGTYSNPFNGVFDGNDHVISNFTWSSSGRNFIGLFGFVNGDIMSVRLLDAEVDTGTGDCIGGLVGWNKYGTITNCYVEGGSVSGDDNVGGLVGENHGMMSNCYVKRCSVVGDDSVGGLAGRLQFDTISNCYSAGSVIGDVAVGGLVGYLISGTTANCFSSGSVIGNSGVGGLVGWNKSKITNCYSTASVVRGGGLVGYNYYYGKVIASFWDIETSGQTTSAGGTGKTTDQMQMISTFTNAGWDFVDETANGTEDIWKICEGEDYPRLYWEKYGGGTGESNNPYLIYTSCQMNAIGAEPSDWGKHFKLMADIDLGGFTGTQYNIIGKWDDPHKPFSGVFDGNGHTISNFTYNSSHQYTGLFGYVCQVGPAIVEIKNLGLIDPNIDAGGEVGALVARMNYGGAIINCYVKGGTISGLGGLGGLVGSNNSTISKCYATASINGKENSIVLGGLCGENRGKIIECYATGSVSGDNRVGGLCGWNYYGSVTQCYATGDVTGGASSKQLGGLCGLNVRHGTISHCYATGSVNGHEFVGGLCGEIAIATISNCYATGAINADEDMGGLCGLVNAGIVHSSFWDTETSGIDASVEQVGIGLPTLAMLDVNTYVGWGDNIWTIDNGNGYPNLIWENQPGVAIIDSPRTYSGGAGTADDPYIIKTADDLITLGTYSADCDSHYKLANDIDLSPFDIPPLALVFDTRVIPIFSGVFDGGGYNILDLTIDTAGENNGLLGMFGLIASGGEVRNLGLENASVIGGDYSKWLGGLCGENYGTISNCLAKSSIVGGVESKNLGALCGGNYGTIEKCYVEGSVTGGYDCFALGGFCGYNGAGISNCYTTASVTGGISSSCLGGICGYNSGKISYCYGVGPVVSNGGDNVGGVCGRSYSYGDKSRITSCYWNTETTRQYRMCGSQSGGAFGCDNSYGRTTAEMQMQNTFTDSGWDFMGETFNGIEDIWFIPQQDYPHLWWEGMHVPMKLTPRTLNCRSEGNWVKAHLTLPQGFTVADVNSNRPAVLHSFGFQSALLDVFINKDKLVEIEAAFEREVVCSLTGDWPDELTVAGFLADGNIYLGTSTVRIIHPGMKVIEELASCWLNTDCVHPDFCDGIDMNRDSLVNLLDYALLMNINVEFVTDE